MKKIDGFTIIELVVVVGIIGVLSMILAPTITGSKTAATAALIERVGKTTAQELSRVKDTVGTDMMLSYSMMGALAPMLYSPPEELEETAPQYWIDDGGTQEEWVEYRSFMQNTNTVSMEAMTGSLKDVVEFKPNESGPPSWVIRDADIAVESLLLEMIDGPGFRGGYFVLIAVPGDIARQIISKRNRAFYFDPANGYAIDMGDMIAIDYGAGNGNTEGIISLHYRIN